MYAPKFRSWMTDWERFDEALGHRLDAMEAEAKAEIRAMVKKAMPPRREIVTTRIAFAGGGQYGYAGGEGRAEYPSRDQIIMLLNQQANMQNGYPATGGLLGLGNVLGL